MQHADAFLKKMVIILAPMAMCMGLALDLYLPSVPAMQRVFEASLPEIQWTLSIFMLSFGFGQLILGTFVDRLSRKKMLLMSLTLYSLGGLLCVLAPTLNVLLSGRALQAVGAAGVQITTFALLRDYFEGKSLTFGMTYLKAATGLAPILAPTLGAFLHFYFGWRTNFLFLTLWGALMLYLALMKVPQSTQSMRKKSSLDVTTPMWTILSTPTFWFFTLHVMLAQTAMFVYFSLSPSILMTLLGFHELSFGVLFGLNAVFFFGAGMLGAPLIVQWGVVRTLRYACILLLLAGLCMTLLHLFLGTTAFGYVGSNWIASAASALIMGAGMTGALRPFKTLAGTATALLGFIEFLGGGILGSTVVYWGVLSELPLSLLLIAVGMTGLMINLCFKKVIQA